MKKIAVLALCFVLLLSLMTACRRNDSTDETSDPSTAATSQTTTTPTAATTRPTTAPTTSTEGSMGDSGKIDGHGDAANRSGRIKNVP